MTAPTMGALAKIRYTHADMMDYLLANPGASQKELASRYGYSQSWVCNIMASDAWQAAFAARREELIDPDLRLTVEQRMRAVTTRAAQRLMDKLDQPGVADNTVLKALELGSKSLNLGNQNPLPPATADHLAKLANRLIDLQAGIRKGVTIDGEANEVG